MRSDQSASCARRYTIDLYDTDYGCAGDNTTDDTAPINSMVTDAYALLDVGAASVVRLIFRPLTYLVAGALLNPEGPGGAYAQIPLRRQALSAKRDNIHFIGTGRGPFTMNENQTTVQRVGTVFRSTATGTLDLNNKGLPSVIGGPACGGYHTGHPYDLSNTTVVWRDITIELSDDPSVAGLDLWAVE